MAGKSLILLTLAVSASECLRASTPVTFTLSEPATVAGVPSVTLGPGMYILRPVDRSLGMNVVQVLSKRQDYVYTTVLAIPANRPYSDDKLKLLFSEGQSGTPPALRFWFPPGDSSGYEFITPRAPLAPDLAGGPKQFQVRTDRTGNATAESGDLYGLREVLQLIERGKLGAARDRFRRNYYLAQNRDGASISFLLALLMIDTKEARASLDLVNRMDPERARTLSDLGVYAVLASLPSARSNLKSSVVRRFLLNLAMERIDDPIARTAVISFERYTVRGDSFPVEIALDRRREELAKEKRREEQWVLAKQQIARLSDCVKSLLNQVGALEYSASMEATLLGSVKLRVVLNQRRLDDLDAIVRRSHRTICDRHSKLERLISERNNAVARELDSLRAALRELDRQPGSTTRSQFMHLRNWETASASGVSHDLMALGEAANSPVMRPSAVFRSDRAYVQLNIAGSLARLAEWAGY